MFNWVWALSDFWLTVLASGLWLLFVGVVLVFGLLVGD